MMWRAIKRFYRGVLLSFGCAIFVYLLVHLGAATIFRLILEVGWSFGWIAATYAGYELVRAFAYWKCATATRHSSYQPVSERPFWAMARV